MSNEKIKRIYKSIMLIVIVSLVTFILTSVFLYNKLGNNSSYVLENIKGINSNLIKKIYTLNSIIDSDYIAEVDENDLVEGAIKGYINALGDDYTEYFTIKEMEDFKTDTEGEYVGVGIYMVLNAKTNNVMVLYPIEGSPAEAAGIKSGDIIKKVDELECNGDNFDTVATNIKGKAGTTVKIEVEREDKTLAFEIERKKIDLYPMKSEMLENNIGYINIQAFDENCAKEFKDKYNELAKKNIKGLVIDLRNNGGGIVEEALTISDYILEKDDIILITKDRDGNEEIEKAKKNPIVNVPIVVLTNGNSASASEILAAALKDNGKAKIVGEKTFGKGVIQELITLSDGSGIKITIEEYFTPNKNKINEIGIKPDEEVFLPEDVISSYKIDRKDDTQLQKAIEILKNR